VARASRIAILLSAALAGMLLAAAPAQAQYSPGYNFLQAVKKKDGDKVLKMLSDPASTLVNSRDITTGESALHIVVERRDLTWIDFLLRKGADPNIRDNKGVTPLVLATRLDFVEGAEALIAKGAKVDIPDQTGETPLIFAVHNRDTSMMRVLLRAGADPDRPDSSGRSARDYAMQDGKDSVLLTEIERNERPADQREGASTYGPSI
jgi:ankyrin repeat protein